jgi:hypothetical protein
VKSRGTIIREKVGAADLHVVHQIDELEIGVRARSAIGESFDAECQQIGDLEQRLVARRGIPSVRFDHVYFGQQSHWQFLHLGSLH